MSASGLSGIRQSWLHRPIHYERVTLPPSRGKVPLELALLSLTLAVLAFAVI